MRHLVAIAMPSGESWTRINWWDGDYETIKEMAREYLLQVAERNSNGDVARVKWDGDRIDFTHTNGKTVTLMLSQEDY